MLTARAQQFGLILDDISITHLTFGREFTQAVELKQVAQQDAEKARFLVEKAEQIKQAAIITAEGDTQAASLIASAMGKLEKLCQIDEGGFKSEGANGFLLLQKKFFLPNH